MVEFANLGRMFINGLQQVTAALQSQGTSGVSGENGDMGSMDSSVYGNYASGSASDMWEQMSGNLGYGDESGDMSYDDESN